MAEIPVEKKSSLAWLWILLALILLGLIIWWIASDDDEADTVAEPAETELVQDTTMAAGAGTLAAVVASPQDYIGSEISGEGTVGEVPTDRGFWVTGEDGTQIFALIIDEPREVPMDINSGQELSFTNALVRDAQTYSDVEGEPLDQDTQNIIDEQQVFLVIDEEDMTIDSRP